MAFVITFLCLLGIFIICVIINHLVLQLRLQKAEIKRLQAETKMLSYLTTSDKDEQHELDQNLP